MAPLPGKRVYNSKRWDAARRLRLYLAKYRCENCGRPGRLHVHHRVPLSHGGEPFRIDNLTALCKTCHEQEHSHAAE